MPRHGEIIEPKERFVTYAHQMDIADEVLWRGNLREIERRFLAEGHARARRTAAEIDPRCPIIITVGIIRTLPDAPPYCKRWGVHVRVEFQRYVYDATNLLNDEWQRTKHRCFGSNTEET